MSEYSEKLKDPRWQKKRLKILERDGFICQICFTDEETLHVHHKIYLKDKDLWDTPDEFLTTLCEDCHDTERTDMPQVCKTLIVKLKEYGFFSQDILDLIDAFENLKKTKEYSPLISTEIKFALSQKEVFNFIEGVYSRMVLKNKRNPVNG